MVKSYYIDDPIKQRARRKVYKALLKGIITRPTNCSNCLQYSKPQAHHYDYDLPLEVIWLCKKCHKALHVEAGTWKKPHNIFTLNYVYKKAVKISKEMVKVS